MSIASRWKLRTFLYLLTLSTIVPAALLVFWGAYNQFKQAEEAAGKQAYNLAQLTADNTQVFLSDAEKLLGKIAHRIKTRKDGSLGCDPIFAEFKNLYPQFANLSQSSPDGTIVCSTMPQLGQKPTYVGNAEWFRRVYSQKRFVIGPPYRGPVTGRMVSVLAYPITNEAGEMTGALQLPIDLVNFRVIPGAEKFPASIIISVFASDGTLIARSREPEKFVGKNFRGTEAVEILLEKKHGTARALTSQNIERIFGFLPIPGTDWLVIAGIATDVVLAPARETALHNILIGVATLLAVFMLALYVSKRISEPIVGMHDTASKISSGKSDARARIDGPREVAAVAHQFNLMLDVIDRNSKDRHVREAEIERFAFYDALTGLPNRRLLLQKIEQAVDSAKNEAVVGAVFYIDLDRFKDINDAKGHQAGDLFLMTIAARLEAERALDDTLARIGGDEFVYVAARLAHGEDEAADAARALGARLQDAIELPLDIDGRACTSSASIGITLFPRDGNTGETLLHEADIAMYQVKQKGRNHVALFEEPMRIALTDRLAIEIDLRKAIGAKALQMYIQTQVNQAGSLTGAELLLRWNDASRGFVSPGVFIPIAEQSDLIIRLGSWVLRQGCFAQIDIAAAGLDIPVSINVSPKQFHYPGFADEVRRVIAEVGADPRRLIFEVTEGLFIEDLKGTISRMNLLAGMGIRFSIDDFGTGYSSLAYLKQLPLYEVKIDQSFIRDIPNSPSDVAIVQSILGMATHLGLHAVAEGVETTDQADFLRDSGCNAMQGYLFCRPLPIHHWIQTVRAVTVD